MAQMVHLRLESTSPEMGGKRARERETATS